MPQMFPEQLFVVSTKAARLTMINSRLTEVQKDNVVKAGAKIDIKEFSCFSRTLLASARVYYVDTPMQTSFVALE